MGMFSIIILLLGGAFWVFRIAITLYATTGTEFMIAPQNFTIEVILLFITLACLVLFIKRSMVGVIIYLVSYLLYFGADFYRAITGQGGDTSTLMIAVVAIIIPFLAFLDIALNTNKKSSGRYKKTDWFFKNEELQRDKDERDDSNQYKL